MRSAPEPVVVIPSTLHSCCGRGLELGPCGVDGAQRSQPLGAGQAGPKPHGATAAAMASGKALAFCFQRQQASCLISCQGEERRVTGGGAAPSRKQDWDVVFLTSIAGLGGASAAWKAWALHPAIRTTWQHHTGHCMHCSPMHLSSGLHEPQVRGGASSSKQRPRPFPGATNKVIQPPPYGFCFKYPDLHTASG